MLVDSIIAVITVGSDAISFAKKLRDFLYPLSETLLLKVADSHLQCALEILDQLEYEKSENGAIQRILTHLETAYSLYDDNVRNWEFDINLFYNSLKKHERAVRRTEIALLVCFCHKFIGNSDIIIQTWFVNKTYMLRCISPDILVVDIPGYKGMVTAEKARLLIGDELFNKIYPNYSISHHDYREKAKEISDSMDDYLYSQSHQL